MCFNEVFNRVQRRHTWPFQVRAKINPSLSVAGGSYLAVLAADALALSWIMPTPTPPTAPASSPSSTSMGTLSISLCFFDDFDILSSPVGLMLLF